MAQEKGKDVKENKMGYMPMGKLLLNMALPMMLAMMVQALYNVVDSIYVSRISESAVTALSLAFPVQNIQIGFATGIGVGVNSLLSKSLGEGRQEMANRAAGNGMFLMLICTGILMLFGFFGAGPYYRIQSDVAQTVEGGITYTSICCIFSLGSFVAILCERVLQSTGRTVYTMITQGTGALLNIVLDPVLIFGVEALGIPAMGIAGAAAATVIGQWVAAVMGIYFNIRHNPEISMSLTFLKPAGEALKKILTVGIPSVIMMAIGSIMSYSMNQIMQSFNETATSVFGVYYKLQSFVFMPVFGINNAAISIIAFNYGARNPDRILSVIKKAALTAVGIMTAGLLIFQVMPDVLLGAFHPSAEFLAMGRRALRILSLHFPVAGVCIVLSGSFQGFGNGIYSSITSACRQLVVLVPAAYLLSLTGDVGNVWWSFPIAEVISLGISFFFFARLYRQKIKPLIAQKNPL